MGKSRRSVLLLAAGAAVALPLLGLPGLAGVAHAADPSCGAPVFSGSTVAVTCAYTGADQSFTYPVGVTSATFTVYGAQGWAASAGGPNGEGGVTTGTITEPSGTSLTVEVGQAPTVQGPGGFGGGGSGGGGQGGGGGGGGESAVSLNGTELLVAGGGGGGVVGMQPCESASGGSVQAAGGAGGGSAGTDSPCIDGGGGGGSQAQGGAAGGSGATAGGRDQGGAGAARCANDGGGGGGYFGGGGGDGYSTNCGYASGGGGSGYVSPDPSVTNGSSAVGGNQGNGRVVITYAPRVTGVVPSSGASAGGTSVTVTGMNFAGVTAVDFGSDPASSFTVNSNTSITATSPAEPAGTVDVTVTATGGTSATTPADEYTYLAPGVSPAPSPSPTPTSPSFTIGQTATSGHIDRIHIHVTTSPAQPGAKVEFFNVSHGTRHHLGPNATLNGNGHVGENFTKKPGTYHVYEEINGVKSAVQAVTVLHLSNDR